MEELNISSSRDLSVKNMNFNIKELNKLYQKNGYLLAKIYTRDEALKEGSKNDDLMLARIERGKNICEITSDVLKVNVLKIHWNSSDSVKIEYLEK